ncbi:hypothetical protein HDU80_005318 [Chytriomyces hyalinus]|nr:hypothetical protein HDU80_005318 [Chytriomyces hyalinus]
MNNGAIFNHFPCYKDWSSQQVNGATIDSYHDALYNYTDEIKFKRRYPESAFDGFQYLANLGHAAGMYSYGYSIMFGQGTSIDRTGGFEWVQKSAKLGFAKAQRQLAICLSKAIGCEQNGVEAMHWAQSAIEQGFVDAHSTVGTMHFEGHSVPVNRAKAMEHYFLGMDAGSIDCISQVGSLYREGTEMNKDVKKAVELYEKAISLGNSMGCCYLGDVYETGDDGIPKDPSKAATCFEQAVQLEYDCSAAKRRLAFLYDKGIGVEQSYELSLRYYLEAAKFEDVWALFQLGFKYRDGTGVDQDYTKAIEFFERAAKQNCAPAADNLGYLLGEGLGCAKDLVRAAQLHQQAAALGDGTGAYNCGVVFRYGNGVPVDLFKAVDYYRMAIRLKCDGAESSLGPDSNISRALYNKAEALRFENTDKEVLDLYCAAAIQGHSKALDEVALMYQNAWGLGPVAFEKEMRYFEPPEVPDTTLSAMPNELLLQIFQWLHPKECILLRPVSRRIRTLTEDDSFPRHLFKFQSRLMPSRDMTERDWFDEMLYHGPRAFQATYLEMVVNGLQVIDRHNYGKYASMQDLTFYDFPATFSKWTSLTSIQLYLCALFGSIPDSIKHLRNLKELDLSCNRFHGTEIPASIMELAHLEVLLLDDCGLTGTLGWAFVQFLKTLKRYSLRGNQLIHLEVRMLDECGLTRMLGASVVNFLNYLKRRISVDDSRFEWSYDEDAETHQPKRKRRKVQADE